MKNIFFVLAVCALFACSSKPKETEETTSSDVEQKVMEATDTTSTATDAPAKATQETSKKEYTSSPSANSEFPAITGTEKSAVTCTSKSDSRKISVLNVTEGGCGVVYNKMGEDKTVAMAKVDMNYCDNVSNKIKSNLEGAGFNCGGGSQESGTSSDTQVQ